MLLIVACRCFHSWFKNWRDVIHTTGPLIKPWPLGISSSATSGRNSTVSGGANPYLDGGVRLNDRGSQRNPWRGAAMGSLCIHGV